MIKHTSVTRPREFDASLSYGVCKKEKEKRKKQKGQKSALIALRFSLPFVVVVVVSIPSLL